MAKVKVWKRADGGISVRPIDLENKQDGESDADFIERRSVPIRIRPEMQGAEEFLMEDTDIPARDDKTRDKWRLSPDKKKVVVDNSVELPHEKKQRIRNGIKTKLKAGQALTDEEAEELVK